MNVKTARYLRGAQSHTFRVAREANEDLDKVVKRIKRATNVIKSMYDSHLHKGKFDINVMLLDGYLYRAAYTLLEAQRR